MLLLSSRKFRMVQTFMFPFFAGMLINLKIETKNLNE